MEEDPEQRRITDKIISRVKEEYGFVPVVNQVLSVRPDLFIPMANVGKSIMEAPGDMDPKSRRLCAVAAATALGGEHCIGVQTKLAREAGATKDEILEAMTIGSYMAMTRAQSYAYRKYAQEFDMELE